MAPGCLARWALAVGGLLRGMVALLGLSEGAPEFLRARGLFVAADSRGPVSVVAIEQTVVIVGNDRTGGFIWSLLRSYFTSGLLSA